MRLIVRLTNGLWTARPKVTVGDNRDLKQSGWQRQGRIRLKNEFLPLIRNQKMAAFVYRL